LKSSSCMIQNLDLSYNRINTQCLNVLCSSLVYNKQLLTLNIEENPIPMPSLKILLTLLYHNEIIYEIKYSKKVSESEDSAKFSNLRRKNSTYMKREKVAPKGFCRVWHLICCLPLSFWHSKHEAFRFKYDTLALNKLEKN
jgi:hypothetical protein